MAGVTRGPTWPDPSTLVHPASCRSGAHLTAYRSGEDPSASAPSHTSLGILHTASKRTSGFRSGVCLTKHVSLLPTPVESAAAFASAAGRSPTAARGATGVPVRASFPLPSCRVGQRPTLPLLCERVALYCASLSHLRGQGVSVDLRSRGRWIEAMTGQNWPLPLPRLSRIFGAILVLPRAPLVAHARACSWTQPS